MATQHERLLARARELSRRGDHARALACYREICAEDRYDPDPWMRRAELAESAGLMDEAIEALSHVCELYARAGVGEAADIAEHILELAPEHSGAHRFLRQRARRESGDRLASIDGAAAGEAVPGQEQPPAAAEASRAAEASQAATRRRSPTSPPPAPRVVKARPEHRLSVSSGVPVLVEHEMSDGVPRPYGLADDEPTDGVPKPLESSEHRVGAATTKLALAEFRDVSAPVAPEPIASPSTEPEKFKIVQAVASIITTSPLLSELDVDLVRYMIDVGAVEDYDDGVVFREGDRGTALYLVLSGSVAVERDDPETGQARRLATLTSGAFFGEISMLTGTPRSATIRASGQASLLRVSRKSVRELIQRQGRVLKLLMRFFRARLVGTLMATSPLFRAMSPADRRDLVGRFRLRELPPGRIAIGQGRPTDGLYVVLSGQLVAKLRDHDDEVHELGTLGTGDVFGEMSLLFGMPSMATVQAAARSWVVRLPVDAYHRTVADHPELERELRRIADERRAHNLIALR